MCSAQVISQEFPSIDDFVRNWVFRGDNQSVGVRYLMIHQILAYQLDRLCFVVRHIEYHLLRRQWGMYYA